MIISIIAALDENGGIGLNNRIPWHLSGDLTRFKKLTMGHHIILGRKTFQSIGGPLPGRQMIVLSRNEDFRPGSCQIASSLEDALELARGKGEKEVFIVGGGEIYRQALSLAERLYLTRVHTSIDADTYFPKWNRDEWELICTQDFPEDESNPYGYTFNYLIRKGA